MVSHSLNMLMGPEKVGVSDTAGSQWDRQERLLNLYDANVDAVYRCVYRLCLDRSLAEDITQDVFTAAIRSTDLTGISTRWLLQTARNRLIDVVRRTATHDRKLRLLRNGLAPHSEDHTKLVIAKLNVEAALLRLSPDHRVVLMLHYVDDHSVADLAVALERSPKGVESLLTRARAAFRAALEDLG